MSLIIKLLHYLWASPNTLVGLIVGLFGLLTGGKMQVIRGVVEFHGGGVRWLLRHSFLGESTICLLYTSPSPRDGLLSRMPSSA